MTYADLGQALREVEGGLVLAVIIAGLAFRSRFRKIPIWTVMAFAAFLTVVLGLVNPNDIDEYVDWDVILFLIGMFSLGALAYTSGLLEYVALRVLFRARSAMAVVLLLTLTLGLVSAFAVNDAVAAMGSLMVLPLIRAAGLDPELSILVLAFAVTIGSTMTPIGNPQNMLIAVESGIKAPLFTFLVLLGPPTVVNLFVTALLLARLYNVGARPLRGAYRIPEEAITDRWDATLAGAALILVIALLAANDVLEIEGKPHITDIGIIPFTVAAGAYVLSRRPREVIKEVSWSTIVFFIVMFVAMRGIWDSGVLDWLLRAMMPAKGSTLGNVARITVASLALSQLLSNVPFVQLFTIYMKSLGFSAADVTSWATLAMASTIAGNLTVLGAASNVIIIESMESRYGVSISYARFAKVGALVTAVNTLIYLAYMLPVAALLKM